MNHIQVDYYKVADPNGSDPFADDTLIARIQQTPGTVPRKDDWVRIIGREGEWQVAVVTWNVHQLADPTVEILLR